MSDKKVNLVMLVDDNPTDSLINEKMIQISSFAESIHKENSAKSALEYLEANLGNQEKIPSMIFLDINMPVMNAQGFLEEFLNFPQEIQNHIKIYMLSSSDSKMDKEIYLSYIAVKDFFTKPLTTKVLENLKRMI